MFQSRNKYHVCHGLLVILWQIVGGLAFVIFLVSPIITWLRGEFAPRIWLIALPWGVIYGVICVIIEMIESRFSNASAQQQANNALEGLPGGIRKALDGMANNFGPGRPRSFSEAIDQYQRIAIGAFLAMSSLVAMILAFGVIWISLFGEI